MKLRKVMIRKHDQVKKEWIDTGEEAYFHQFYECRYLDTGDVIADVFAVIELLDGTLKSLYLNNFRFIDKPEGDQ